MQKKTIGIVAVIVAIVLVVAGVLIYNTQKPTSEKSANASQSAKTVDVKAKSERGYNILPDLKTPAVALTVNVKAQDKALDSIVNALKQNKVRATFFLEGKTVKDHPEQARNISVEGNEIGNYSWSGADLANLSLEEANQKIAETQAEIKEVLMENPQFFRVPDDKVNENVLKAVADNKLHMAGWSVDSADAPEKNADAIAAYVLDNAKSGVIIVLHDSEADAKALPKILKGLAEKNLKAGTLAQTAYLSKDAELHAILTEEH